MPPEEWDEVGKWASAVQTFLLLAFFLVAIFLGANFRLPPKFEDAVVVELVNLPPPSPTSESEKTPPNPEPGKTPPPEPEPQAVQTETPAEISLRREEEKRKKDEEEARKKREEEKRRREEEKKREEDERKKREEEKRLAEEKKREEKERKKREEERKLAESQAEEDRKKREADKAQREVLENLKDSYIRRIKSKIRPHLVTPPEARGIENLEVVVEVRLNADGFLEEFPGVLEKSGVTEYDEEAMRAMLKAAPFVMPKEPELLEEFRVLTLRITPE